MNPQERRGNCRMSMVIDRSTSIEEFPEIRSGGKDVSTSLLRLHIVVSYVMALGLRAVVACVQGRRPT